MFYFILCLVLVLPFGVINWLAVANGRYPRVRFGDPRI